MGTETTETAPAPVANIRYRNEKGTMISKEVAIAKRWAHKEDGSPTKIYLHRLAVREARKNGEPIPVRAKKRYEVGSQSVNDVPSPYDLNRRSGYGVIWQVLAENVGQVVPVETLNAEVNASLKDKYPEWYTTKKGYGDDSQYDTETNAYVMTRKPYNAVIESMAQRVTQEDDGFMLSINVTEPRTLKKRGRKPKAKVEEAPAVVPEATVEVDNDVATVIEAEAPAEAVVETPVEVTTEA